VTTSPSALGAKISVEKSRPGRDRGSLASEHNADASNIRFGE
jgi:hypothetical protein